MFEVLKSSMTTLKGARHFPDTPKDPIGITTACICSTGMQLRIDAIVH
jgi:hypothetical protein